MFFFDLHRMKIFLYIIKDKITKCNNQLSTSSIMIFSSFYQSKVLMQIFATIILSVFFTCSAIQAQSLKSKSDGANKYGYVKEGGTEWVIPPIYENAYAFANDAIARVRYQGKYGYISPSGKFIIQPHYDSATDFYHGIATVKKNNVYYAINLKEEKISPDFLDLQRSGDIYWGQESDGSYYILNADFKHISDRPFQSLSLSNIQTSDNPASFAFFFWFTANQKRGVCDLKGNDVIPANYTELHPEDYYYAVGYKKCDKDNIKHTHFNWILKAKDATTGKYGVLDILGNTLMPFTFKDSYKLYKGTSRYYQKAFKPLFTINFETFKKSVFDRLNPSFMEVITENQRLAETHPQNLDNIVLSNEMLTIKELKPATPPQNKKKQTNDNETKPANYMAFFNGEQQVGPIYKEIIPLGFSYMLTDTTGKMGIADVMGTEIIKCEYEDINIWRTSEDGNHILLAQKNEKSGLISVSGSILTPIVYSSIFLPYNNTGVALKDTKYYLINASTGKIVTSKGYDDIDNYTSDDKITAKLAGFSTTISTDGKENPRIVDQAFQIAYDTPDENAQQKYDRYMLCLSLCEDKSDRGTVLNNIGALYMTLNDEQNAIAYYEKAQALGNTNAANNLKSIKRARRLEMVQQIGQAMIEAGQAITGNTATTTIDTSNDYSYTNNNDVQSVSSSSSEKKKLSYETYKSIYDRWERNAKSCYESLTLLGSKEKKDGKDVRGSANGTWGTVSYTGMKQNLRKAQKEMRNTRADARRDGYNIPQSNYETVTVSY